MNYIDLGLILTQKIKIYDEKDSLVEFDFMRLWGAISFILHDQFRSINDYHI